MPCDSAQRAIEYLDKALKLDKDDHLAWYYKGFCIAQIGYIQGDVAKIREGLDCFVQALRTRPGDPSTTRAKMQFEAILRAT